jgi:hypothetical protein
MKLSHNLFRTRGAKSLNYRLLIFGLVAPDINILLLYSCELDNACIINAILLIMKPDYLILFWLNARVQQHCSSYQSPPLNTEHVTTSPCLSAGSASKLPSHMFYDIRSNGFP